MTDSGKNESEELLGGDEESERSIASVEDQLRKEMTIYEVFKWNFHILPSHLRKILKEYLSNNMFFKSEIHHGNAHKFWKHGARANP